jgi:hypothetical protein
MESALQLWVHIEDLYSIVQGDIHSQSDGFASL